MEELPWSQGAGASLYTITGQNLGHTGVDLSPVGVQYGTTVLPHDYPIYSVTDGTVYAVGSSGIGGNYIMIKIKDTNQMAYYGHLKEVLILALVKRLKLVSKLLY